MCTKHFKLVTHENYSYSLKKLIILKMHIVKNILLPKCNIVLE